VDFAAFFRQKGKLVKTWHFLDKKENLSKLVKTSHFDRKEM
jgi:hypothetical protein